MDGQRKNICLPRQSSVTPFLSGAPLLRKIVDRPVTCSTFFTAVSQHNIYFLFIQLESLLTMIQNKVNGNDPIQLKDSALQLKSSPNNSDQEEDLNKLDDYELDKRKAEMDKDFEKNRIKPGDEDFVYDKEVEFNEGKMESGWDDDDEYSDPEF